MKKISCIFAVPAAILPMFLVSSCEQEVAAPESITIVSEVFVSNSGDQNTFFLTAEDTRQVEVAFKPADADNADTYGKYNYKSSNNKVFTVNSTGLITAVDAGEAVLTVTPANNKDIWCMCLVVVEARSYPVTSITFVDPSPEYYAEIGDTFNVAVSVSPANADDPTVIYSSSDEQIATVSRYGEVTALALGDVSILASATDGSNVKGEMKLHVRNFIFGSPADRTGWVVTTSHPYSSDNAVVGTPESIIDGNVSSCLSLVKPGKNYNSIDVGSAEQVFFVVDMRTQHEYDYLFWGHRRNNEPGLRPTKVTILGSNDEGANKNWTMILENTPLSVDVDDAYIKFPKKFSYRYLKAWMTGFDLVSYSCVHISEFNVGIAGYEPLPDLPEE